MQFSQMDQGVGKLGIDMSIYTTHSTGSVSTSVASSIENSYWFSFENWKGENVVLIQLCSEILPERGD